MTGVPVLRALSPHARREHAVQGLKRPPRARGDTAAPTTAPDHRRERLGSPKILRRFLRPFDRFFGQISLWVPQFHQRRDLLSDGGSFIAREKRREVVRLGLVKHRLDSGWLVDEPRCEPSVIGRAPPAADQVLGHPVVHRGRAEITAPRDVCVHAEIPSHDEQSSPMPFFGASLRRR